GRHLPRAGRRPHRLAGRRTQALGAGGSHARDPRSKPARGRVRRGPGPGDLGAGGPGGAPRARSRPGRRASRRRAPDRQPRPRLLIPRSPRPVAGRRPLCPSARHGAPRRRRQWHRTPPTITPRCNRSWGGHMLEAVFNAIETNLRANRGLPGPAYTSDSFFEWECRNVFERGWFALAFGADAPSPGDLFPVEAVGMSFVVARGDDMELRVFHNVCRHRGRRLVDGPAQGVRLIRCPYHAWTYRLDGRLQGTPHIGGPGVHDVCGFAREDHSLFEVPSATWLDIVFVNPGGDAGAFADHVAPLAARLDSLWGAGGDSQLAPAADSAIAMTVE